MTRATLMTSGTIMMTRPPKFHRPDGKTVEWIQTGCSVIVVIEHTDPKGWPIRRVSQKFLWTEHDSVHGWRYSAVKEGQLLSLARRYYKAACAFGAFES